MKNKVLLKINNLLVIVGIFSFLFLWDIKPNIFEPRYLIGLPVFSLIFLYNYKKLNLKKTLYNLIYPIFICFHLLILSYFFQYNLNLRDFLGLVFLLVVVLVTTENFNFIIRNFKNILNYFVISFSVIFLIFLYFSDSNLILDCYDGWFFKNNLIFVENSHFAIISVPIISYFLLEFSELKKYKKNDWINLSFFITFLTISFINFSTTFLLGLILSLLAILIKKYSNIKFLIFSIFLLLLSVVILTNYKQCIERSYGSLNDIKTLYSFKNQKFSSNLNDLSNTKVYETKKDKPQINMSIETLFTSLEITKKSFFDKPFGVGFNKYHIAHNEYIDQINLVDPDIKKNNIFDGSTNISKLITEFGIFGIIFILFVPFFYFTVEKISNIEIFLLILISMQFLRGVGYFNGGFLLAGFLLFFIFYKFHYSKKKKKN